MLYAVSWILGEHSCLLEQQLLIVDCFTIGHDDLFTRQLHVVTKYTKSRGGTRLLGHNHHIPL